MLVLTVAVGLTSGAIGSIAKYSELSRETSIAQAAAEEMLWTLRQYEFERLFADHNTVNADDNPGAPGPNFGVPGLDARRDDADGLAGRIILPEDPDDPSALREDLANRDLGLPFDLNLDGVLDAEDRALDYALLPVRVIVEWRGRAGNSRVLVDSVIGQW